MIRFQIRLVSNYCSCRKVSCFHYMNTRVRNCCMAWAVSSLGDVTLPNDHGKSSYLSYKLVSRSQTTFSYRNVRVLTITKLQVRPTMLKHLPHYIWRENSADTTVLDSRVPIIIPA